MQTLDFVSGLHNCLEFPQPLSCLYQAMQTRENVFYCLNNSNSFCNSYVAAKIPFLFIKKKLLFLLKLLALVLTAVSQ